MLRAAPSFRRLMFGCILCCLMPHLWFWSFDLGLERCQRKRVLDNRGPRHRNGPYSEAVPPTVPRLLFPAGCSVFLQPFSRNELSISSARYSSPMHNRLCMVGRLGWQRLEYSKSHKLDSGRTWLELGEWVIRTYRASPQMWDSPIVSVLSGVLGVWNLPDLLFGRLINKEREGEGGRWERGKSWKEREKPWLISGIKGSISYASYSRDRDDEHGWYKQYQY